MVPSAMKLQLRYSGLCPPLKHKTTLICVHLVLHAIQLFMSSTIMLRPLQETYAADESQLFWPLEEPKHPTWSPILVKQWCWHLVPPVYIYFQDESHNIQSYNLSEYIPVNLYGIWTTLLRTKVNTMVINKAELVYIFKVLTNIMIDWNTILKIK